MADTIPARLTRAEGRRFGVTVGLALVALAGVARWRGRMVASAAFAAVGSVLLLGGLAFPAYLGPVFRVWMGAAHAMSRVTTPLVLASVYFGVVTPVALVMRLFGKSPLRRPAREESGWVARDPGAPEGRGMERQF